MHVHLTCVRTCKHTESHHSILTSLDLNLLIFSRSPPAFILFFITAANTKGATDGKNLSSTGYIINPLKQQFTGGFWSLFLFCNKMRESVSISASLILLLFLLMQSEKQRRHDPLAHPHILPTIYTQQVEDASESKICKHAPGK